MSSNFYSGRLSNQEVIDLFNVGKYKVDLELGIVYSGKDKELYTFTNQWTSHKWVRLFCAPKSRSIGVSQIVWMVATQMPIPEGWHIHHIDQDPTNNSFNNLMALHPKDHNKLHSLEEAPF